MKIMNHLFGFDWLKTWLVCFKTSHFKHLVIVFCLHHLLLCNVPENNKFTLLLGLLLVRVFHVNELVPRKLSKSLAICAQTNALFFPWGYFIINRAWVGNKGSKLFQLLFPLSEIIDFSLLKHHQAIFCIK